METRAPRAGLRGTGWFSLPQGLPLPSPRSPRVPRHSHPASLQALPRPHRAGARRLSPAAWPHPGEGPPPRSVVLGTFSAGGCSSPDTEPGVSISRPPCGLCPSPRVRAACKGSSPSPSSACRPATHPDHASAVPALHASSPCLSPTALGGGLSRSTHERCGALSVSSRPHSSQGQPSPKPGLGTL